MDPLFDRVVIAGAGLLGASLGLGLQETGTARHITGVGRRQSSLDKALAAGAVHETSLNLAEAAADADLVVIATPAGAVTAALDTIASVCSEHAIVIDVASTKAAICAHAGRLWGMPRRFVGCHPMAGSEKSGPEHATATLYNDTICLVEESAQVDQDAFTRIQDMWQRLGARVVPAAPEHHDALVAQTSHIPHILATTIATLAVENGATTDFIGNGFRDMTRIAAGSPEMWRDITRTNREAVAAGLTAVKAHLDQFLDALEQDDGDALMTLFATGKKAREKVVPE